MTYHPYRSLAQLVLLAGVLVPLPRMALAVPVSLAADPTGPMVADVPTTLCTQVLPPWEGLPPNHPLANQNDPAVQAAAVTYAATETLRLRQAQFCMPVVPVQISRLSKTALPLACTQAPEAAALQNPLHPLAYAGRTDVIIAEQRYLEALARVETLRKACLSTAVGSN